MANSSELTQKNVALVLTGGGARGAYQAGVIQGLSEIFKGDNCQNPIRIVSGLSAGSINGAYIATGLSEFEKAAEILANTWAELRTTDIFKSDPVSLGKIGFKLLSDVTFGSFSTQKLSQSLLDTRPLGKLLAQKIPFDRIEKEIQSGHLHGVTVSAFSYSYQRTAIFYQARTTAVQRLRPRRKTRETKLDSRHVMASTAIPLLFPPINIDGHYFGDGSIRATAPFSPPIRLGADKMLIVGVRKEGNDYKETVVNPKKPSIAEILGMMLNSLFFDSTEADMEKLTSINHMLKEFSTAENEANSRYRPIDFLWLRPSEDLGNMGMELSRKGLPSSIQYLLGGLGSKVQHSELASYLLFDKSFTQELIDLGRKDTIARKDEILDFLSDGSRNLF